MKNIINIFFPSKYLPNTEFQKLLKFDIIIITGSTGTGKSFLSNLIMENSSRYTHIGETDFIKGRIDKNTLKNDENYIGIDSLHRPIALLKSINRDLNEEG